MLDFIRRSRVFLLIFAAAAILAVYFFTGDKPQQAQNQEPQQTKKTRYADFAVADSITTDIRSERKEIVRVDIENESDRADAAASGTIIQDFGSFVIVIKDKAANKNGGRQKTGLDMTVNLPGANFDPIASTPDESIKPGSGGLAGEKGYYVLQLGGLATDEWLDSLRDAGVEIVQYVPHQAFFVYADGEAISKAASHSRVRWVGRFTAAQKISKDVKDRIRSAAKGLTVNKEDVAKFDVAVFSRSDLSGAAERLKGAFSGRVLGSARLANNYFNIIRVEARLDDIERIAEQPEVVRIDPYVTPSLEDERSSQIIAGNFTNQTTLTGPGYDPSFQFGVDGTGVTVAVLDDGVGIPGAGGFYLTSANTVDGPLRGALPGVGPGHGHLVASIVAGGSPSGPLDQETGYNYGRGVAPKAHILNIPFLKDGYANQSPGADATAIDDVLSSAGPNGVVPSITNQSWGAAVNLNAYDSYAALYDGLVRDGSSGPAVNPISIIFSAGNCGLAPSGSAQCNPNAAPAQNGLTRPKVAKNIISVASSENLRSEFGGTSANNIDDLSPTSSRGPAADGRIKPDITAPGTFIFGSRGGVSCTNVNCHDNHHAYASGTSFAAPQVSGAAALFTQHFKNQNLGQNPSPAMVKAAILNSGQEMTGANTSGSSVPNGNEGWGRLNMKYVIDNAALIKRLDQTVPLTNVGERYTVSGTVNDASRQVRVALVWSDPPGVADPALVNNLDLTVTIGGVTYKGNVFQGGRSVSGGNADSVNNVEHVWLPAGIAAGTSFSVSVSASALNGDGILGNSDTTDQNFALVVYNFNESAQPISFLTVSGRVTTPDGMGISGVIVTITDLAGISRFAVTNHFGYYRFLNTASNQSYTVSVRSRRHTFTPRNVVVSESLGSVDFIPTGPA